MEISKCDNCDGTDFREYWINLDLNVPLHGLLPDGQKTNSGTSKQWKVWTRFCIYCGRVTLWSKPSK